MFEKHDIMIRASHQCALQSTTSKCSLFVALNISHTILGLSFYICLSYWETSSVCVATLKCERMVFIFEQFLFVHFIKTTQLKPVASVDIRFENECGNRCKQPNAKYDHFFFFFFFLIIIRIVLFQLWIAIIFFFVN